MCRAARAAAPPRTRASTAAFIERNMPTIRKLNCRTAESLQMSPGNRRQQPALCRSWKLIPRTAELYQSTAASHRNLEKVGNRVNAGRQPADAPNCGSGDRNDRVPRVYIAKRTKPERRCWHAQPCRPPTRKAAIAGPGGCLISAVSQPHR